MRGTKSLKSLSSSLWCSVWIWATRLLVSMWLKVHSFHHAIAAACVNKQLKAALNTVNGVCVYHRRWQVWFLSEQYFYFTNFFDTLFAIQWSAVNLNSIFSVSAKFYQDRTNPGDAALLWFVTVWKPNKLIIVSLKVGRKYCIFFVSFLTHKAVGEYITVQ